MTKATYLKVGGIVTAAAFGITLAVLVGDRLSTEAMAVLAGAVCGVGAAIPTSLLIIAVSQRRQQSEPTPTAQQPQYTPPMVFTVPPVQIQQPPPTPQPATWENVPTQRRFTVVGKMGEE